MDLSKCIFMMLEWYINIVISQTFTLFLAAWCGMSCYCKTEKRKRWGKRAISTSWKTDTHVSICTRYSKCCCLKQWEKRFLISQIHVHSLFEFLCGFLRFFIVRVAIEDSEVGPDGKRIRQGISNSIISELTDCNSALSQQRKRRQVSPRLL